MTSRPSPPSPPSIRVLIADDHLVVREGLRAILEAATDLVLVGEATDGVEAVRLAGELSPDVVLMDLRMPGMDGIEAIRQIKTRYPAVEIIILTTYDDDAYIVRGLRAGARGYLLKDAGRQVLFEAIRAAARGESLLPPAVVEKVVAHLEEPRPVEAESCQSASGSAGSNGPGCGQQRDRGPPAHRRAHRQGPRDEHLQQTRRELPHRGCSRRSAQRPPADRATGVMPPSTNPAASRSRGWGGETAKERMMGRTEQAGQPLEATPPSTGSLGASAPPSTCGRRWTVSYPSPRLSCG